MLDSGNRQKEPLDLASEKQITHTCRESGVGSKLTFFNEETKAPNGSDVKLIAPLVPVRFAGAERLHAIDAICFGMNHDRGRRLAHIGTFSNAVSKNFTVDNELAVEDIPVAALEFLQGSTEHLENCPGNMKGLSLELLHQRQFGDLKTIEFDDTIRSLKTNQRLGDLGIRLAGEYHMPRGVARPEAWPHISYKWYESESGTVVCSRLRPEADYVDESGTRFEVIKRSSFLVLSGDGRSMRHLRGVSKASRDIQEQVGQEYIESSIEKSKRGEDLSWAIFGLEALYFALVRNPKRAAK